MRYVHTGIKSQICNKALRTGTKDEGSRINYNTLERSNMNYKNRKDTSRIDVYYFDHGNAAYNFELDLLSFE